MIPVVMGASKDAYNLYGPQVGIHHHVHHHIHHYVYHHELHHNQLVQGSFIHVDDFSGPAELASYLNYLDKNDTAYNMYFRWRGAGIRQSYSSCIY